MSDSVERLRDLGDHASFEPSAYHAAADGITRLRAENERLRDVLMRIGLPGKQIVYCRDGHEEVVLLARAALKEADKMTRPSPPRKPCSSPIEQIRYIFDTAESKGMTIQDIANRSGYSVDTISTLRRPRENRANGSGLNPSFRLVQDIAQSVGLKIEMVPHGE